MGMAGMGEYCAANFFGSGFAEATGEAYVHAFYLAASGGGAKHDHDGIPHMFGACIMGNMGYESIELVELARPLIVWDVSAVPDSGGAGTFRGATGVSQTIQPRDHTMHLNYCGSGHTCPAFGLEGGEAGFGAAHRIAAQASGEIITELDNAGSADVSAEQTWIASTGGGGGYGDPMARDVNAVIDDVVDGFVSQDAARDIYHVCLNWRDGEWHHDAAATSALRGAS